MVICVKQGTKQILFETKKMESSLDYAVGVLPGGQPFLSMRGFPDPVISSEIPEFLIGTPMAVAVVDVVHVTWDKGSFVTDGHVYVSNDYGKTIYHLQP